MGNRGVQQLVESGTLRGITVNRPDDEFEKEAERVAERAVHASKPDGTADVVDKASRVGGRRSVLRRRESQSDARTRGGDDARLAGGSGRPLPDDVRSFFEPRFGYDLRTVRVHTGTQSASLADALDAHAFTSGRDIYFGRNEFQPNTASGKRLLAHELTHVIQQDGAHTLGNVLQRNEREGETEPVMEFSLWETYDWRRLQEGFQSHRSEIRGRIKSELTRYAILAQQGAEGGVNEIFDPYEDDLVWKGAHAGALTSGIGMIPEVGSVIAGIIGTTISYELARQAIQIDALKDSISGRLENRINERLIYEGSEDRENLTQVFERRAAEEYKRILNEGRMTYDPDRGGETLMRPESDAMKDALVEYVDDLIVTDESVKTGYQNLVVSRYKPIVDEKLRVKKRTTDDSYLGYGAYKSESGIIYQGPGPKY